MSLRICDCPKSDGILCGSPPSWPHAPLFPLPRSETLAVRWQRHRRLDVVGPRLPPMKSLADIQLALGEILNALANASGRPPRATARLFDLQLAAVSLYESRYVGHGSHATHDESMLYV